MRERNLNQSQNILWALLCENLVRIWNILLHLFPCMSLLGSTCQWTLLFKVSYGRIYALKYEHPSALHCRSQQKKQFMLPRERPCVSYCRVCENNFYAFVDLSVKRFTDVMCVKSLIIFKNRDENKIKRSLFYTYLPKIFKIFFISYKAKKFFVVWTIFSSHYYHFKYASNIERYFRRVINYLKS